MRTWSYLNNPILIASENNFHNALGLSTHHDTALNANKADPFILSLYKVYHPLHLSLNTAYDAWQSQGGSQKGESLNLAQLLSLLSHSKIQSWDIKIQNVYGPNTPQYTKLLPNHRVPFQRHSQKDQIHAVSTLAKSIGADASLAAVKAEIDAFATLLNTAFDSQKTGKKSTRTQSEALQAACVAMSVAQYANLGALIQKYAATPEKAEGFFDLSILRSSSQVYFKNTLKPEAVYTFMKHTFAATDTLYLKNNGSSNVLVYLATSKDQRPGTKSYVLTPGEHTVLASVLGLLTDTFVTVYNPDKNLSTSVELELL